MAFEKEKNKKKVRDTTQVKTTKNKMKHESSNVILRAYQEAPMHTKYKTIKRTKAPFC